MKTNMTKLIYACVITCFLAFGSALSAENDSTEINEIVYQQWEYKIVYELGNSKLSPDQHLNNLGKDGWELVAVERASENHNANYIFKRPAGKAYPDAGGNG